MFSRRSVFFPHGAAPQEAGLPFRRFERSGASPAAGRPQKSRKSRKDFLKLSTKCRQLERQKWELPKKFPFLHRLYCERGLPSPLALSPCESDLFCMGLSTVRAEAFASAFLSSTETRFAGLSVDGPQPAACTRLRGTLAHWQAVKSFSRRTRRREKRIILIFRVATRKTLRGFLYLPSP